jgi:hypothetical protein
VSWLAGSAAIRPSRASHLNQLRKGLKAHYILRFAASASAVAITDQNSRDLFG